MTTLLRREPLLLGITAGFVLALGLGAGIVLGVPAPAERALAARTLCLIMGLAVGGTAAGVAWRIHPRSRRAALAWASLAAAQLSLCWSLTAAGLSAGLVSLASSAFFLAGAAGLPAGRTSGRQRAQQALDTAAMLLAAGLL
ncbi:MAG: hypothetical protein JNK29_20355, partial [Anaerolineales bacterium]|nr:hypothetical protein [Anaerolineales bacterium]